MAYWKRIRINGVVYELRDDSKVALPAANPNGASGQYLRTKGNGQTEWITIGTPTSAQVKSAIDDWLEDHPDERTTVADGAVSYAKLNTDLKGRADLVTGLANFINYTDIAYFTATPASVEIGNASASVNLSWSFNATPSILTLNGASKSTSSTGETVTATDNGSNHTVSYTLATAIGSSQIDFHFYPKLYWGVAAIPQSVDSAFVLGLSNSSLASSRSKTITVNATSGKYIWFASPVNYGACSFKVGGFSGGFEAAQTVSVTNASGYTQNYYVYRSTNASLGNTTVAVS